MENQTGTQAQAESAFGPEEELYRQAIHDTPSYYMRRFERFEREGGYSATFHWAGFLFGPFWAAYRKLYGLMALLIGIQIALNIAYEFVPTLADYSLIPSLAIMLFMGFGSNYLYFIHVRKLVATAKMQGDDRLRDIYIATRGGSSLWPVLALIGGFFVAAGILYEVRNISP